ncbi:MAG: PAS domain S-box protein [bacterium]|nr:PAS domain S-box protein [bacterium]
MKFKNTIFKEIRKEKRWSLTSLAEATNISRKSLSMWENGRLIPSEKMIRKLSHFLEIPISNISDLEDEIEVSQENISSFVDSWSILADLDNVEHRHKINNLLSGVKALDTKLKEASLIIKAILTSTNSPIYIKGIDQNYIIANDSFKESLNLDSSFKVAGKTDRELFSIHDAKDNLDEDVHVLLTGNPVLNREDYLPGGRKKKWGLISKMPIFDLNNKVAGLIGLFVDITEKKKADSLRELLEVNVNAMNAALFIFDIETNRYVYINSAVEKIFGYSLETMYEGNREFWLNTCVHPDDRDDQAKFMNKYRYVEQSQYRIIMPDGKIKWIESQPSKEVIFKNRKCIMAICSDITKQKTLVEQNEILNNIVNSFEEAVIWGGIVKRNKIDYFFITDNIEKITGYNKQSFMDDKIFIDEIVPDEHKILFQGMRNLTNLPLQFEHAITCEDGSTKWFDTKLFTKKTAKDDNLLIGFHIDITEKKELQLSVDDYNKFEINKFKEEYDKKIMHKLKSEGISSSIIKKILT